MDYKDIVTSRIYDLALGLLLEEEQFEVKDLVPFCCGDDSLPMQIVEEFLDRKFIIIETTKAYTFAKLDKNGNAKRFRQKGGFVAEYEEEQKQKELKSAAAARNQKYTDFLKSLKEGKKYFAVTEYKEGFDEMIDELIAVGLVRIINKTFYSITKEGIILISRNLTYDDYLDGCLDKKHQSVVYQSTNYNAPSITGSNISAPVVMGSIFGDSARITMDNSTGKQAANTSSDSSVISNKNKLLTIFGIGLSAIVATLVDVKELWEFVAVFINK